ncbi:MAG: chromosome segregation protein SMC [Lachnospiraceae bacterium]|nr:chromosome segregation protein SMC [Lachnospiraceae bacterium]
MYLKSIEIHGFKSFANKIVFDFHNGITGIVGPNGSGKSNVADAVRWVLGEQSAKQLRGASMQDVIFAGTENRKPLSYAYVAITLDNTDHQLAIDFSEVTVARRVYRSGESEYLINGSPCRLKDVSELFYDTGIGKEGYSIIGQGQIEKILSGKPEERRELFDEAAGIVKYKRRKVTAQKKLDSERENLVRVNDILAELERQVGPLEKQSEKAKIYLKKKEELKTLDVNMFLLEVERIQRELSEVEDKYKIADQHLKDSNKAYEDIKLQYEKMEQDMEAMDAAINQNRENLGNTNVMKGKLEGQINVLKEQIKAAQTAEETLQQRLDQIAANKSEKTQQLEGYLASKQELDQQMEQVSQRKKKAEDDLRAVQDEIARCNQGIEDGKNEIIELLNQKASLKAKQQKFDTMAEQVNIRKAQLNQRLLKRKSEEADLDGVLAEYQLELQKVNHAIEELKQKEKEDSSKLVEWRQKTTENRAKLEQATTDYHKQQSRLESLKNIAERYDGYGNSIRRVMEQKEKNAGILGVVADLIKVEKKYETAIETALGGNIQNIVTKDEDTAKEMIRYLKENRYGRATFLPLTSVTGKDNSKNDVYLTEPGVIGNANTLVKTKSEYDGVMAYLLGRVFVVDTIDHAITLARKSKYSLHIVTLEGEYLSPGGSMAGGAFKNSSNLLGRKREIDDLEKQIAAIQDTISKCRERAEQIQTAQELLKQELEQLRQTLQGKYLEQNTAQINVDRVRQQKDESLSVYEGLKKENQDIEEQLEEIRREKKKTEEDLLAAENREKEIGVEAEKFQSILDTHIGMEEEASKAVSAVLLEEASFGQKAEFLQENLDRVNEEIRRADEEAQQMVEQSKTSKDDAKQKEQDIEEIRKTILASDENYAKLERQLSDQTKAREEMSAAYKGFFEKREEISREIANLDKEIFRLNSQREKLEEASEYQTNYMWEEYELTPHNAKALRDENYQNLPELKKQVSGIKDEIRKLGDVNVNAIEEYKELSERYGFLKTQHDDLVEAEATLLGIIQDLDTGMRKQFTERFAEIQTEFDKAFKQLFGGGKGTLELVEDEDILECGIRIIAQPPGKKLQNMMQLSGGEKSLTAIALLFAIQNLKPSPFCLLDEIEAALDDSNVGRFANYLHKLTKNTQFIVITHRRGTMAAADRLYGITMQEKGVSTLVSVNLIEGDLDK